MDTVHHFGIIRFLVLICHLLRKFHKFRFTFKLVYLKPYSMYDTHIVKYTLETRKYIY